MWGRGWGRGREGRGWEGEGGGPCRGEEGRGKGRVVLIRQLAGTSRGLPRPDSKLITPFKGHCISRTRPRAVHALPTPSPLPTQTLLFALARPSVITLVLHSSPSRAPHLIKPSLHPHHTLITPSSYFHYTLITPSSYSHHTLITSASHSHYTLITLSSHPHHTLITHYIITSSSQAHHQSHSSRSCSIASSSPVAPGLFQRCNFFPLQSLSACPCNPSRWKITRPVLKNNKWFVEQR